MGPFPNRVRKVSMLTVAGALVSPVLIPVILSTPAARAADYAEASSGDLSGDRFNPTPIAVDVGLNNISATSVAGDLEYFRISIPPGARLTSVTVSEYSSATSLSFLAVQTGMTFTQPPSGTMVGQLLGWTHFGAGNGTIGTDILDNLGTGSGAIGFTGPLGSGAYTFWSQETAGVPASYTLTFSIAAVPAPVPATGAGAALLLAIALVCVGLRRWMNPFGSGHARTEA